MGAKRELKEAAEEFDDNQIKEKLLKNNCNWITFKMNVPSPSHMGGVWERQIRTVQSVLSSVLRRTAPNWMTNPCGHISVNVKLDHQQPSIDSDQFK